MASDDLKHLVAREIASGETVAEVARRHGYTWKGMKKLVDTPEVQALVQAERHCIAELGEQCRAKLLQLGPQALDNIAEVLRNRKHPKCLETSRFVVDKLLPPRTMLEAAVSVGASVRDAESQAMLDEAMIKIANSLQALREANAGRDPLARVRTGHEFIAERRLLEAGRSVTSAGQEFPVLPTEKPRADDLAPPPRRSGWR